MASPRWRTRRRRDSAAACGLLKGERGADYCTGRGASRSVGCPTGDARRRAPCRACQDLSSLTLPYARAIFRLLGRRPSCVRAPGWTALCEAWFKSSQARAWPPRCLASPIRIRKHPQWLTSASKTANRSSTRCGAFVASFSARTSFGTLGATRTTSSQESAGVPSRQPLAGVGDGVSGAFLNRSNACCGALARHNKRASSWVRHAWPLAERGTNRTLRILSR